eukprot:TRINITY_DN62249_c0_g1_i3.p1 TRINITY_DN62249_c0_g1~~TRINITY_DN62249_c0_g1_i3.p1  ORF type:complete len:165 (-),score=6.74 TRINITY_DN62249_c0_g1_i3:58-552(-)
MVDHDIPTPKHLLKLMFSCCIALQCPPLIICNEGNINRWSTCQFLHNHIIPYMVRHGLQVLYWDLAPGHRSNLVKKYLIGQGITVQWAPGNSPDMNPIERVFGGASRIMAELCEDTLGSLDKVRIRSLGACSFERAVAQQSDQTILGLYNVYNKVLKQGGRVSR